MCLRTKTGDRNMDITVNNWRGRCTDNINKYFICQGNSMKQKNNPIICLTVYILPSPPPQRLLLERNGISTKLACRKMSHQGSFLKV